MNADIQILNYPITRFWQLPISLYASAGETLQGRKIPSATLLLLCSSLESGDDMSIPAQPNIRLVNTSEYRDGYANSVQIRVSVWDFLLVFGRVQPQVTGDVEVHNFQGIYLSPQQAKALMTILEQNVIQYEKTFGEIKLDPSMSQTPGQIH